MIGRGAGVGRAVAAAGDLRLTSCYTNYMKRLGILHDERFKHHDTGSRHPESPARLDAVGAGLRQSNVLSRAVRIQP
ncbi:MAG: hypothetical protein KKI02_08265, partial [Planctomycetes bacterium]|nr:hypothetical protein [Planctomycetota bacterium]